MAASATACAPTSLILLTTFLVVVTIILAASVLRQICSVNQLTSFYMRATLTFNGLMLGIPTSREVAIN